jgi:hypothetical protein
VSTGIIVLYFSTQHFLFAPGASGLASLRLSAGELFLKPSAGQSAFSYKKVLNYFHCFATQRVPSSYPITRVAPSTKALALLGAVLAGIGTSRDLTEVSSTSAVCGA